LKRRFDSAALISALLRPYPGFGPPGHKNSHKTKLHAPNARFGLGPVRAAALFPLAPVENRQPAWCKKFFEWLIAAYLGWRLLRAIKNSGDINSKKLIRLLRKLDWSEQCVPSFH
jgi:hypothetical protein